MQQPIKDFHKDSEGHWVADLSCGHAQHVRHDPPWMERPWVLTQEGRAERLGTELNCVRCDEVVTAVTQVMHAYGSQILKDSYEQAGISGLCGEGRWEVALSSFENADFIKAIEEALRKLAR